MSMNTNDTSAAAASDNANDVLTIARANLETARADVAAAEAALDVADPDNAKTFIAARDRADLARARLRKSERAVADADRAATEAGKVAAAAELANLRAQIGTERPWGELRGIASQRAEATRQHEEALSNLEARASTIVDEYNALRSRAVLLAAQIGEAPPRAPALPAGALELADILASDPTRSEQTMEAVFSAYAIPPMRSPYTGRGAHQAFPPNEQIDALLAGTFLARRAEIQEREQDARRQDQVRVNRDAALDAIARTFKNYGPHDAERVGGEFVTRGSLDWPTVKAHVERLVKLSHTDVAAAE
jgi:hypothetical protein